MSNLKLAIRVRPFTERELKSEKDRIPVIDVCDNNTVTITNTKVSVSGAGDSRERVRRYFADYTFDSACAPSHPNFATQEKVFTSIGRDVLSVLSAGRSACVLAYGQSATGKTHTMMGTDEDPGLIPKICTDLAQGLDLEVTVSFVEIYNERVCDLLTSEEVSRCRSLPRRKGNARKDLRVREHPHRGPFVQNLRRVAVRDLQSLLAVVREGCCRRHTAATRRNSTSSRSHALLEIVLPHATLHLVDLAGSEKASWEGCAGGRQKEGANINKSLVALSNVISALVRRGSGKSRFVPYRDSALTWLLKDCFTGGANTFIIATVSPSVSCYGESASTLRWAERARQLPPPVPACTSTANRLALQAQLDSLLAELARHYIIYVPEKGKIYFEESYWNQPNKFISSTTCSIPTAKIGNIMKSSRQKTDAQNSESTASSVASESSDVLYTMDKNVAIQNEINEEVDKILGPVLERARSGTDLEVVAPNRHKKRQYRSQEVLSIDKKLQEDKSLGHSDNQPTINGQNVENTSNPMPTIFYDNQRAEIVASVTDRLYSKFKKKEEAAVSKMEAVVDKKIIEPLSELRICTNARQRLIDLSRKSARNKRRIGIPAYTQTKHMVIRVRDQGTDIQSDLEPYVIRERDFYTFHKEIGTETMPMTPRCKEKSVGPKYGSVSVSDTSTATEITEIKKYNTTFVMTDEVEKLDSGTQTLIIPPPRRKKRLSPFAKYIRSQSTVKSLGEAFVVSPAISINISQNYSGESESQSSDENIRNSVTRTNSTPTMTPDLLTNHSNTDKAICLQEEILPANHKNINEFNDMQFESECIGNEENIIDQINSHHFQTDDFSDSEDHSLPRVKVCPNRISNQDEIKNLILGKNLNTYPYNVNISPYKNKEEVERTVKFQESSKDLRKLGRDDTKDVNTADKGPFVNKLHLQDSKLSSSYDTDCSKTDSDSFIYKSMNPPRNEKLDHELYNYKPMYKAKKTTSRFYREFLGHQNAKVENCCPQCGDIDAKRFASGRKDNINSQERFIQNCKFFEGKVKLSDSYEDLEKKVLTSCDLLHETSIRYGDYFARYCPAGKSVSLTEVPTTRPTEYLQHLINLRKEAIKAQNISESIKQEIKNN